MRVNAQHAEVATGHQLAHQHLYFVSRVSLREDVLVAFELGDHSRRLPSQFLIVWVVQRAKSHSDAVAVEVDQRLRCPDRCLPE